jgi:two-component system sensor histidine kinase UhpB
MESFAPLDTCPDANEMVTFLQVSAENARARLSRELHNEMGGLLVSAVMDVAFAEQALAPDDRLRHRLARARGSLAAAIDLKRTAIETLRPSILDNFGLFEAIRWEVKHKSRRARLPCSEIYPAFEPAFTQDAAIVLFRIVQESLSVALRQPLAKAAHIALDINMDTLHISVSHDSKTSDETLANDDMFTICSAAYRVHALGGRMAVTGISGGGARYSATLPLARLTTPQLTKGALSAKNIS